MRGGMGFYCLVTHNGVSTLNCACAYMTAGELLSHLDNDNRTDITLGLFQCPYVSIPNVRLLFLGNHMNNGYPPLLLMCCPKNIQLIFPGAAVPINHCVLL